MTIIVPSPQLLIHAKNKDYVTQISHREHKSRNLNSNINSILDDCTINLSLMCFNGVNPAIHQARVYSSVIISDFIELNNPKNPLFYGSLAASANDFENAIYWYKVAAKRNSVTAMNAIGHIYLKIYQKIKIKDCDQAFLSEDDNEEEEEESFWNNYTNYKQDMFYKCDPSKEALKWYYRAYRSGSIQSLQYIANVFEAIKKKTESLHYYRKHYENTIQQLNVVADSSLELFFSQFGSLYSKYKIGRLLNFFNYNNISFVWFISCAESYGHLKSIQRMLETIKSEKNYEQKSYDEIYSNFLNKIKSKINNLEKTNTVNQIIEKNIKLAQIISILKFKSIISSRMNNQNSISNLSNENLNNTNTDNDNNNNDTNIATNSEMNDNININNNSNNINDNSNKTFNNSYNNDIKFNLFNNSKIGSFSSESLICADTALDIFGWSSLQASFSSQILTDSSYMIKPPFSTRPLEVPSFKNASRAFWLIEPLTHSQGSSLSYESSIQKGSTSPSFISKEGTMILVAQSEPPPQQPAFRSRSGSDLPSASPISIDPRIKKDLKTFFHADNPPEMHVSDFDKSCEEFTNYCFSQLSMYSTKEELANFEAFSAFPVQQQQNIKASQKSNKASSSKAEAKKAPSAPSLSKNSPFLSSSSTTSKSKSKSKPKKSTKNIPSFDGSDFSFGTTTNKNDKSPFSSAVKNMMSSFNESGFLKDIENDLLFDHSGLSFPLPNKTASSVDSDDFKFNPSSPSDDLLSIDLSSLKSNEFGSSRINPSSFTTLDNYPTAFFPSATKTQYLHLALKFASPSFSKRNLQLSLVFLQKMWLQHPKGISESSLFRSKCKSKNPKHLIQCGFLSIICHDSRFALDLFARASRLGNETGSLMTGLLMFHGLNVARQVKSGCFFLAKCSTDPVALLHLGLACGDEIYEERAKEAILHFDEKKETRCKLYEWVGDLFSNAVKLPLNVGIALMFYGIAMKKAEEDGDEIDEIIKKISTVSREPAITD